MKMMKPKSLNSSGREISLFAAALLALSMALFWKGELSKNAGASFAPTLSSRSQPTSFAEAKPASPAAGGKPFQRQFAAEAPKWAVAYGQEFWRRKPATNWISSPDNVAEIVERVSHAFAPNGAGGSEVRAKTYTAAVSHGRLQFSPALPSGINSEDAAVSKASFSFRTVRIQRGQASFYHESDSHAPPRFALGNTAQTLLSPQWGVTEHYQALAQGIEAVWVFPEPLPGAGPLTVEAGLEGMTFAGTTSSGAHFADDSGVARVRIGKVTAVDAAGSSWEVPTEISGNRLLAVVSAETLSMAQYPLAIDPVISPEFNIDNPVIIENLVNDQIQPVVASSSNGWLVAWIDGRIDGIKQVFAARISQTGENLDPSGITVGETGYYTPAAASNGSDYFVLVNRDKKLVVIKISSGGTVENSEGHVLSASADGGCSLAFNGTNFLAVWMDRRTQNFRQDLYGSLISAAGIPMGSAFPVCVQPGLESSVRVISDGHDFYAVWQDTRNQTYEIFGSRISPEGVMDHPNGAKLASPGLVYSLPAIATLAGNYLVAWVEGDWKGGPVRGLRLSSSGAPLDASPILLATAANTNLIALASVDGKYLLAWTTDHEVRAGRIQADGTALEPNGIIWAAQQAHFAPQNLQMASSGGAVWAVWDSYFDLETGRNVYGMRIGPDATPVHPQPLSIAGGSNREESPAVAFSGSHYLVVWEDNRHKETNNIDILGARVGLSGQMLDPNGIAISVKTNAQLFPKVASGIDGFFVVWQDSATNLQGELAYSLKGARIANAEVIPPPAEMVVEAEASALSIPNVASDGTNYFVAWRGNAVNLREIYGVHVLTNGIAERFVLSTNGAAMRLVALASGPQGYLAAWPEREAGFLDRLKSALIAPQARALSNLNDLGIAQPDRSALTAGGNGTDFLVSWVSTNKITYRRIGPDGSLLSQAFNIPNASGSSPAILGLAGHYILAWKTFGEDQLLAVRVQGEMVLDNPPFQIAPLSSEASEAPALAFDGARFIVVRADTRSSGGILGIGIVGNLVRPFQSILHRNGQITIAWPARAGTSYQVQTSAALVPAAWADLGAPITATNELGFFTESVQEQMTMRFYRIVETP